MKEKIFKNVIANAVLLCMVITVFLVGFSGNLRSVIISGSSIKAHNTGNTDNPNASIVFHIKQDSQYLDDVLQVLQAKKVPATFFLSGSWVTSNESSAKRIGDSGHEIGNLGYMDLDFKKLSKSRVREEIDLCAKVIESASGAKTTLFSPPNGAPSKITLEAAHELGYQTIGSSLDLRGLDEQSILSKLTKKAGNGCIILLGIDQATPSSLAKVIDELSKKNLRIVTISQNIAP